MSDRPGPLRLVRRALAVLLSAILLAPEAGTATGLGPIEGGALPGPLPLFPPDNWWNIDVSGAPVDPNSTAFINFINNGGTRRLHPDFGGEEFPGSTQIYGFPFVVVDGTQEKVTIGSMLYADESDGVGVPFYPIPAQAITLPHWLEGGDPGNVDLRDDEDRHLLIVDRDNKYLYELYNVYYNVVTGQWEAGAGAFWDMKTNQRRPEGWTSADAAGLAILPGLVRYDEAYDPTVTEIRHALRVTVRASNGHVYPASHTAGSKAGALPMGARLRLKASKDISGFTPEVQKIFRAMKSYGLIVADNGSDMYISGTFDTRWNNDILNPAFGALTASDFEVIQLGWNPVSPPASLVSLAVSPTSVPGGQTSTGTVSLSGPAPSTGAVVTLSSAQGTASVPSSVTIGAGATSASFAITTAANTASTSTSVAITASFAGAARSATLTVMPTPVMLSSLTMDPNVVTPGSSSTGKVLLSRPAPAGGVVITLASSKTSVASVPQRVTVAAGKWSTTFTIATNSVFSSSSAVISGSYNGSSKSATIWIRKP